MCYYQDFQTRVDLPSNTNLAEESLCKTLALQDKLVVAWTKRSLKLNPTSFRPLELTKFHYLVGTLEQWIRQFRSQLLTVLR